MGFLSRLELVADGSRLAIGVSVLIAIKVVVESNPDIEVQYNELVLSSAPGIKNSV